MKKQGEIKKEQAVTPARSRDIATSSLTLFVIRVQRYCFFLTYANFASKKIFAPIQLRWTKNLPSFEAWEAR